MQKIKAIIQPFLLTKVVDSLRAIPEIAGGISE
jgi:nitrogen regulatory protein PII